MSMSSGEDLFDTALLLTMREDLQEMKTRTDQRLAELEETMKSLANDVKKLVVLRTVDSGDEEPKRRSAPSASKPPKEGTKEGTEESIDIEDISSNWNYIIAKKGGYNDLLHSSVHELLDMGEDAVSFLTFLIQKREYEVRQQLHQLQAEYQRLQGNQLQEHFRELWKSHYMLLKHKKLRTWKEEVFLAAFDAFITWLQT